jgi:hypothetical protein
MAPRPVLEKTGVSISDILAVEAIVTRTGGTITDIVFRFNEATDEYEAFEIALRGTPVARYDDIDGWVVP